MGFGIGVVSSTEVETVAMVFQMAGDATYAVAVMRVIAGYAHTAIDGTWANGDDDEGTSAAEEEAETAAAKTPSHAESE